MNESNNFNNNLSQSKDKKMSNSDKNQSNSDNKLKNFGQWSAIAQNTNSSNQTNLNKKESFDSFQHFKQAAKGIFA